jgi:hypothetical protein
VNYYSSLVTNQRYQQNLSQATSHRTMNGNVSGNWSAYSLSATTERSDYFGSATSYQTQGSLPRVSFSRAERPIAGAPIYFGVNSEYVTILRSTTNNSVKSADQGLTRVDVNPAVRIPFTRWPFLTVNSVVSWRGTYWTESLASGAQVHAPVGRRFFDFQTRITGPVFNRIWNPGNGYAEKFKHVIEPTLTIQHVTAIDNFDRIVQLESTDYTIGTTRYSYGLSNRLYAKKTTSREILSATISQNYYTDANAAKYDQQNQSGFGTTGPTHFNPVMLQVRGAPTDRLQADFRTDWDAKVHTLRSLAANGSFSAGWVQATGGWSRRRYIPTLRGFDDPLQATNYLNANTSVRRPGGHIGADYSFSYDLRRDTFLQQRYSAYYNAQCCGVGIDYQSYNLQGSFAAVGLTQDHRFNFSFTLAGLGTFSNLFGAFGGQNR